MELTILMFLNLAAWVVATCATVTTIRHLKRQGEYVLKGRHVNVPVKWPAVIAAAAWLWLIAGWCL